MCGVDPLPGGRGCPALGAVEMGSRALNRVSGAMVITVAGGPSGQVSSLGKRRCAMSMTKAEGPRDIQYPFLVS